ncbi:MAG: polysaccharide deacetylase family protein [Byssovorax sp.]
MRSPALAGSLLLFTSACATPPAATSPAAAPSSAPVPPGPSVEIAVTVDDLPAHGPAAPGLDRMAIAERLIAAFRAHHLPPVYGFVNGAKVEEQPETEAVLRRWIDAGNPLGNHTFSHPSLHETSLADYLADLDRGEAILAKLSPERATWKVFRYPFLYEGDTLEKRDGVRGHLAARGYRIAEVTIDADDWAFNPPFARCLGRGDLAAAADLRRDFVAAHVEELERMRALTRALAQREVPQVLLLHIGAADADAIDALLTAYEHAGARFVELGEALADPFYAIDPHLPMRAGAAFPYVVARSRGVTTPPPVYARDLEERLDRVCR